MVYLTQMRIVFLGILFVLAWSFNMCHCVLAFLAAMYYGLVSLWMVLCL